MVRPESYVIKYDNNKLLSKYEIFDKQIYMKSFSVDIVHVVFSIYVTYKL